MPKFFIAVIPPVSIFNEIIDFQKIIEQDFGSLHAQKAPPHITIIPPFDCSEEKLTVFQQHLTQYIIESNPQTTLFLNDFQRFDRRTLFVDVAKNEQFEHFCKSLKRLFNAQKIIKQRDEKHFFVPHITIANKDIHKRDFEQAWCQFSLLKYRRSFSLNSIVILQLVEHKWEIKKEIIFDSCT